MVDKFLRNRPFSFGFVWFYLNLIFLPISWISLRKQSSKDLLRIAYLGNFITNMVRFERERRKNKVELAQFQDDIGSILQCEWDAKQDMCWETKSETRQHIHFKKLELADKVISAYEKVKTNAEEKQDQWDKALI